jgi:integrase
LGDAPLPQVDNKTVKSLVTKLAEARLSAKTIVEIIAVVKTVVASAVDDSGEQIYPREWNHEYIDLPIVKSKEQDTPTVEAEEVSDILSKVSGRYRVLYALLAGTGLRIGEALAIEIGEPSEECSTISSDCKTIHIRKSVWRGRKQDPKTDNAVRDIDVPASLAAVLKDFIGNHTSGFVFHTKSGRPLSQRNILRDNLRKISNTATFHAFRRFRITNLREAGVPEDILRFWIGHANRSVTDRYSKMKNRIPLRKEWAEKAGLCFDLGRNGPTLEVPASIANAA